MIDKYILRFYQFSYKLKKILLARFKNIRKFKIGNYSIELFKFVLGIYHLLIQKKKMMFFDYYVKGKNFNNFKL